MSPMIYTIYGFAMFFFVFWCGKWFLHISALSYGKYKLHRKCRTQMTKTVVKTNEPTIEQQQQEQQLENEEHQQKQQQQQLLQEQQQQQQQIQEIQQTQEDHRDQQQHELQQLPQQQKQQQEPQQLEPLQQESQQQQQHQHLQQHQPIAQQDRVQVAEHSSDEENLQQELQQPSLDAPSQQQQQTHSDQQQAHIQPSPPSQITIAPKVCKTKLAQDTPLPSVSILKPLMGIDPNLPQNLETFFTMNYETYELLFCVESSFDPVVGLVESLMRKYPLVDSKLFIGGTIVGVNPKINNMHPGYEAAKYEMIMISDSGIKMKEDTLLDMMGYMTSNVGLVHQLPFTCDRDGFAATFEKIFFGTIQSRIYLSADLLGINCHTGMSCIMRKSVLEEVGGLRAFGCYLAEDFFIAQAFIDNGWKLTISSQPALQNSGICDISTFQTRLTRWAKLRVAMVPTMILLEPLSECMVLGALASWSVSVLFHWDALVFYLVHILMWLMSDWLMLSTVQNGSLPFNKFEFVVGWLLRECTGPYLFFNALWDPAIRWRERVFRLAWGGIAYEITEDNDAEKEKILPVEPFDSVSKMRSAHAILSAKSQLGNESALDVSSGSNNDMLVEQLSLVKFEDKTEQTKSSSNDDHASSPPQHRNACISISIGP